MARLLRKLHVYCYYALVSFFFVLCYPFLYYYTRRPDKYYHRIVAIRRWFSVTGLYTSGIRIHVNCEVPIDWSKNYVICANHSSILDITVLNFVCKSPFSFVGKAELLRNPITRSFFKTIDIPVQRDSRKSAFQAYKLGLNRLQEGRSVAIFPEGGINDEFPPQLHPFKSGAFRMAQETKTPILPVVIQNAWELLWDSGMTYGSKPGCIQVHILAPINSEDPSLANNNALETVVFQKMNETWRSANK